MARPRPKRKAMSDRLKLIATLKAFGLTIDQVAFDHDPALELRPLNEDGTDTVPPQLDPGHIFMLRVEDHKAKTFGRRGESDLSISYQGDVSRIAKARRLTAEQERFRERLLAKEAGQQREESSRWPKRKFQSRRKA